MFQLRTLFAEIEDGSTGTENLEDEMEILGDQDETSATGMPDAEDEVMGGMGTGDDYGLSTNEFARGEIDVSEQMARTSAAMEKAGGRLDGNLTHVKHIAIDTDDQAPESPNKNPGHIHKGESTGAYTDIGAGRSGVTKSQS